MNTTSLLALIMFIGDPSTNIKLDPTVFTSHFIIKLGNEKIIRFEDVRDMLFSPFGR